MGSILHMDTDAVRDLSLRMNQSIEDMVSQVELASRNVQGMDWLSPAQAQFTAEFEQARAALLRLLQEGEALNQRVTNEVREWEKIGQGGVSRFSGMVDPSFNFSMAGGLTSAVGTVIAGVSIGIGNAINNVGKWWEENRPATPIDKNKPMSEQDDYLLQKFAINLERSSRGKEFMEELKREKLGFRLPDGTVLGDPDGKIVPIQIAKTDELVHGLSIRGASLDDANNDGISNDPAIIISEEWLRQNASINHQFASATLAHEMQHQLDDHLDRTISCDPSRMLTMDEKELEVYISTSVQSRYESEVRAWKLGHEVNFLDSGDVPLREYESVYQTQIGEYPGVLGKYHVRVELSENDTARINLIPLEQINGKPAYIG